MPSGAVQTFSDADQYAAAIRGGAVEFTEPNAFRPSEAEMDRSVPGEECQLSELVEGRDLPVFPELAGGAGGVPDASERFASRAGSGPEGFPTDGVLGRLDGS